MSRSNDSRAKEETCKSYFHFKTFDQNKNGLSLATHFLWHNRIHSSQKIHSKRAKFSRKFSTRAVTEHWTSQLYSYGWLLINRTLLNRNKLQIQFLRFAIPVDLNNWHSPEYIYNYQYVQINKILPSQLLLRPKQTECNRSNETVSTVLCSVYWMAPSTHQLIQGIYYYAITRTFIKKWLKNLFRFLQNKQKRAVSNRIGFDTVTSLSHKFIQWEKCERNGARVDIEKSADEKFSSRVNVVTHDSAQWAFACPDWYSLCFDCDSHRQKPQQRHNEQPFIIFSIYKFVFI